MARLNNGKRIFLLDELRGLAVLCMVFYHGFFTLSLFSIDIGARLYSFFSPAQPYFACLFIFICGISSRLSHSNYKRGFKLLALSLILSAITVYVLPLLGIYGCEIYFGILHLLSFSILLFALLSRLMNKLPALLGLVIFLVLFIVTYNIPNGYIGVKGLYFNLPDGLYKTGKLFALGFPSNSFYSADYFPILPWIFIFFSGSYAGIWAKEGKLPRFFYKQCIIPLGFLGRHALIVYLLHQPIIFLLVWLADFLMKLI